MNLQAAQLTNLVRHRMPLAGIASVAIGISLSLPDQAKAQSTWVSKSGNTLLVEHVTALEFNETAKAYLDLFHGQTQAAADDPKPKPKPKPTQFVMFRVYSHIPGSLTTADGVAVMPFDDMEDALKFSQSLDDRTLMSGLMHNGSLRTLDAEILFDPVWYETIMTCLRGMLSP